MSDPKRRILNIISKKINVCKKIVESEVKSKKTTEAINWLLQNGFILSVFEGSENMTLTEKGEDYRHKLNRQFMAKVSLFIAMPAALLALLTIIGIFSNGYNDKRADIIINSPSPEAKDTTFFIKDSYSFNGLIDSIEDKSNFVHSISSDKYLEISYSGEPIKIRENYFYYPGGNLVIKLNGNTILLMDSIKIEKTNPNGTLQNIINKELNHRVKQIVLKNKEVFVKEIILLLNQNNNLPKI